MGLYKFVINFQEYGRNDRWEIIEFVYYMGKLVKCFVRILLHTKPNLIFVAALIVWYFRRKVVQAMIIQKIHIIGCKRLEQFMLFKNEYLWAWARVGSNITYTDKSEPDLSMALSILLIRIQLSNFIHVRIGCLLYSSYCMDKMFQSSI